MANIQTRRLTLTEITADRMINVAVQELGDYTPSDKTYTSTLLVTLERAMQQSQQAEIRAQNTLAASRDAAFAAEWALHNAVLRTKAQVIAQYGPDSDAIQSLGLKKKSDRKRPVRRATRTAAALSE